MVEEIDYRILLDEYAGRLLEQKNLPNILEYAFDKQIEFIKDKHKQKILFCTRRSAKSFTAGLYLVREALLNPGCNCLFVGLTRASAKAIIWKDILSIIDTKFNLKAGFNKTDLIMTLPNGSEIVVTGIDVDEKEMYKLLGRKYRLVCIDEASMYTVDVRNLVYGILGPAMVDPNQEGESGTICLMGTASDFPRGLFYDITINKERGWKLFHWTAYDNPYVKRQWQEALDKIAEERPEYMETPQYKQWYLNQWVIDEEKLVYRFDMSRNLVPSLPYLPHTGWTFVLGVDTGWEDDSAFVLTAYHVNDPFLYVAKVFKKKKMTFEDVVSKIQEFMKHEMAPHKVIIDGANKQGVESMRARSAIPFEYADKQDKVTFIELCNSDLIQGRVKIVNTPENRPLWEEMAGLVWVTDGDKIKYPKKEHPSLPNHLCDAFLYAWRCGWHYASTPMEKKIVQGSREWYQNQSEGLWERERQNLELKDDWPSEGSLGDLG
jgi:phage terminase large subunit